MKPPFQTFHAPLCFCEKIVEFEAKEIGDKRLIIQISATDKKLQIERSADQLTTETCMKWSEIAPHTKMWKHFQKKI